MALRKNPANYFMAVSSPNEKMTSPFTQIFFHPCNQVYIYYKEKFFVCLA
ncbi:MAG: hypothetical protein ACOX2N_07715 [Peptococcia bacterium]